MSTVPRSRLVMVRLAPGALAPLESVTVPAMLPYTAWAVAGVAGHTTRNQQGDTGPRPPSLTAFRPEAARDQGPCFPPPPHGPSSVLSIRDGSRAILTPNASEGQVVTIRSVRGPGR